MLKIATALIALMAMPATACELVSRDGMTLEMPDPMSVVFVDPKGGRIPCTTTSVGTGIDARGLVCGEAQGLIFSSPTTLDGPEDGPSFVVAMNTVFFERCDPTPTDMGLGN